MRLRIQRALINAMKEAFTDGAHHDETVWKKGTGCAPMNTVCIDSFLCLMYDFRTLDAFQKENLS